ncbi:MAG: hypothetical protein HY051_05320 [Candidatus Aenigmarchaeota archaeon]|nr:hypothetical protein [Candidatus Aenigmarchaeota archaeon]
MYLQPITIGNYIVNSAALISALVVITIAGAVILIISSNTPTTSSETTTIQSPIGATFTEDFCMKKLQLSADFLEQAVYEEKLLNYNIDRSYSDKEVIWKVYSVGEPSDINYIAGLNLDTNTRGKGAPPLDQRKEKLLYFVFSDIFQGCGKINRNASLNILPTKTMICEGRPTEDTRGITVSFTEEITDQYFHRYTFFDYDGIATDWEETFYVAKPFQQRIIDLMNYIVYVRLGCN